MSVLVVMIAAFIGSYFGAWVYEFRAARSKIKIQPQVFKTEVVDSLPEFKEATPFKRKKVTADQMAIKKDLEIDQSSEQVLVR
jgi:hypothetical protein